jgi:hypothetical protein
MDIAVFLTEVYDLGKRDPERCRNLVFDALDRLLCDSHVDLCDQILASVEVERLPSSLLRSFLVITAAAKEKLPSRSGFFSRAFAAMEQQRGPDRTRRLLERLA